MGKAGRDWLLKRSDGEVSEAFEDIGGLRSTGFSGEAEGIDVTNQGSEEFKEILDGAGIRSFKISGSGVCVSDAVLDSIEEDFFSNTIRRYQAKDMGASGKTYTGSFKITSFERTGEYNGAQTWSLSLESSGEIVRA